MPSRPTISPLWDTGNVHSAPPTVGHIASGFAVDEVPDSDEENGYRNNQGNWIAYVDGQVHKTVPWPVSIACATPIVAGLSAAATFGGTPRQWVLAAGSGTSSVYIPVTGLPPGAIITDMTFHAGETVNGLTVLSIETITEDGVVTVQVQWSTAGTAGVVAHTMSTDKTSGALPITVPSSGTVELLFSVGGGGTAIIEGATLTVQLG